MPHDDRSEQRQNEAEGIARLERAGFLIAGQQRSHAGDGRHGNRSDGAQLFIARRLQEKIENDRAIPLKKSAVGVDDA